MASRGPRPAILVAAGVAAGVALAVALVSAGDGDGVGVQVATGAGPVPAMAPAFVPAGLAVAAALDLPLAGSQGNAVAIQVYGDPAAAGPFERGDLAVISTRLLGDRPADGNGGEDGADAVEVRGRPGTYTASFAGAELGLNALRWQEDADLFVQVVSRSFSRAELVAAAGALDISPGGPVAARPLPRRLRLVASQTGTAMPGLNAAVPLGPDGHVVSYTSAGSAPGPQRHLLVGSHGGGDEALDVLRWFYGPSSRPQPVGDRQGLLATLEGSRSESCTVEPTAVHSGAADRPPAAAPPRCQVTTAEAFVLAWATPHAVVVLSSSGMSQDDLLAAAASVAPLDGPAWERLQADARARQGARQPTGPSRGS